MVGRAAEGDKLLTPAEVAALFRVDPKTVTRWAKAGKLTSIRTLGGHRRYRASEVYELLDQTAGTPPTPPPSRPAAAPPGPRGVAPRPRQPEQSPRPSGTGASYYRGPNPGQRPVSLSRSDLS